MFSSKKLLHYLLLTFLFLLPWQTRLVYESVNLNGGFWEYGSSSLYATELIIGAAGILYCYLGFKSSTVRARIRSSSFVREHWPRFLLALLLISFAALSLFRSGIASATYTWYTHLAVAAMAGIMIASLGQVGDNGRQYVKVFWISAVLQGVFAILQFAAQEVVPVNWLGLAYHAPHQLGDFVVEAGGGRWLRAYGSFGSPNILGGFLAVSWVFGFVIYLTRRYRWPFALGTMRKAFFETVSLTLGQSIILIGLLLSFSRSAWLAALGGTALLAIIVLVHKKEYRFDLVKQIFFALLIIVTTFFLLKPLFVTRTEALGRLESRSIIERVSQYQVWKDIFKSHPLIGVSPVMYTYELWKQNNALPVWRYQPIHNTYALILAEVGLVGLALFFYFFISLFVFVYRHNRTFLPILFTVAIAMLFDHFWWSLYSGAVITVAVVGLSLGKE